MAKIDGSDPNIKGLFFEVGGNMKVEDSEISVNKDAVLGVQVKGDFSSKNSYLSQGKEENLKAKLNNPWLVQIGGGLVVGLVLLVISFYIF
jgi:outer membrane protein W